MEIGDNKSPGFLSASACDILRLVWLTSCFPNSGALATKAREQQAGSNFGGSEQIQNRNELVQQIQEKDADGRGFGRTVLSRTAS